MKVLLTLTSAAEFQLWFQATLLREQVLTTTEMEKHGVVGGAWRDYVWGFGWFHLGMLPTHACPPHPVLIST